MKKIILIGVIGGAAYLLFKKLKVKETFVSIPTPKNTVGLIASEPVISQQASVQSYNRNALMHARKLV